MLMLHSQRRTGLLITAKNRLLFFQRRSVPKFHSKLNQAYCLIAATDRPRRLLLICRYPHHFLHQLIILAIGIGSAVFETQQINRRLFAFTTRCVIEINPSRFQRTLSKSGVCLMISRSAWITVSWVLAQICSNTSP